MKSRPLLVGLAIATAAALGACGDVTSLKADRETVTDTLSAYALNGTPPDFPSAFSLAADEVVRAAGQVDFDIAFDLDAQGQVVVYPLKMVKSALGSARQVGLQKVAQPFDAVLRSPSTGFSVDSVAMTLAPGEVLLVKAQSTYCSAALSPNLYAKIVVDSVRLATRRLYFRTVIDPNCGFRSFAPGVPKD
jgi:hypothetical protein